MRTLLILGYILGITLAIPIEKDGSNKNRDVKASGRMEKFRHPQQNDAHLIRPGSNQNQQSKGFYLQFSVTKGKKTATNPRANIHIYSNTTSQNEDMFGGKPQPHKLQENNTNKIKVGKTFESGWFKNISCGKMDDGHLNKPCRKIILNKRSTGYQTTQDNTCSDANNDANIQNTRNGNDAFNSSEFNDPNDSKDLPYDYTTYTHSNALSIEFNDPSDSNESSLPIGSNQEGNHGELNKSGTSSSFSASTESSDSSESRESDSNSGSKEVLAKLSNELSTANDSSDQGTLGSISTASTTNWNVSDAASNSDSSDDTTGMSSLSVSRGASYSSESSSLSQSNESDASTHFSGSKNLAK
uniref:Secretory calcium-binding phosphoprotein acidic 1 n=1 Tax=Xenopus tropicalis TaxID=8364 RepID=B9UIU7_XENTR|nr:secretory calcium-binding phosphoprotein acidic 1 [Xenopus tropicalis]|eukprot:NP_001139218.1 dentin sialophosphoprotein precursor [Xenopus tropicalis]